MEAVGKAFSETDLGRGVSVQWSIEPLSDFESRPLWELAERYDLINMDHPHVGDAVATGCLRPIGGLANEYVGPSLDSYRMRGKCWCAPIDASCMVSAYYPDCISDVPRRYDDVFALAQEGRRIGASLAGVHSLMALLTLLSQLGHPIVTDENLELPSIDILKRAAELLRELRQVLIKPSLSWNPIQLLGAIGDGECDYAVFTFAYVTFQNRGIRFAPVPGLNGASSSGVVIGGTGLAVSASSRHPEAALAFARFAASEDVQTKIWPEFGGQPAHRKAWDRLGSTDEFYRSLRLAIETSYVRPRFSGWNEFQRHSGDLICSWLGERHGSADTIAHQIQSLWADASQRSEHRR